MNKRWILGSLLVVLVTGAGIAGCDTYEPWDEAKCPPTGTKLTYQNFGKRFITQNCASCHEADDGHRQGAPDGDFYDSHEAIKRAKDRIYERAAGTNDSMPPGPDDPPIEDREKLAEWLACGAP